MNAIAMKILSTFRIGRLSMLGMKKNKYNTMIWLVVVVLVLFPNVDPYGIIKRPFLSFSIAHTAQCTMHNAQFFFSLPILKKTKTNKQIVEETYKLHS